MAKRGASLQPGMIRRAYRVRLELTVEQSREFARYAGVARAAYNWALGEWRRQYRAYQLAERAPERTERLLRRWGSAMADDPRWGWKNFIGAYKRAARARRLLKRWKSALESDPRFAIQHPNPKPNAFGIHRYLTSIKKTKFPWMTEVPALVVREAVADVGMAYEHFFRRLQEGKVGKEAGEPRFRSRHGRRAFHLDQGSAFTVEHDAIVLPAANELRKRPGLQSHDNMDRFRHLRIHKRQRGFIPSDAKLCGIGISEHLGHWYAAVRAEVRAPKSKKERVPGKRVGVEVGVRSLAVTSDGKRVGAQRDLETTKSAERRLALWSRRMSRRYVHGAKRQSAGWMEAKAHVQRCHAEIARTRDELLHYTANRIVETGAATIVMREPAVQKMIGRAGKSGEQARARNVIAPMVSKVGWYELRRKTEYKQRWAGGDFLEAPATLESTRTCSVCRAVRASDPGYPTFRCPSCGHHEDRESNSSKVLRDYRPPSGGHVDGDGTHRQKTPRKRSTTAERTGKPGGKQLVPTGPDGDATSLPGSGNGAATQVADKGGRKPDPTRPPGEPGAHFLFPLPAARGDAPDDTEAYSALASPPDGPDGGRSQRASQPGGSRTGPA